MTSTIFLTFSPSVCKIYALLVRKIGVFLNIQLPLCVNVIYKGPIKEEIFRTWRRRAARVFLVISSAE